LTSAAAVDPSPLSGKTTFLRALSTGEIPGLPPSCQVLHVEQEVVGDGTPVLQVGVGGWGEGQWGQCIRRAALRQLQGME
jgi:hypothetical protein